MALTKRQKVLIGVGCIALGVFVIDLLRGAGAAGPQEAEASPSPTEADVSVAAASESDSSAPTTIQARAALASRLTAAGKSAGIVTADVRDAFTPSPSWAALARRDEPLSGPAQRPMGGFADTHRLEATVLGEGGGSAIVNGICLTVGAEMDGFVLVSVGRDSAVLASGPNRITLQLDSPAAEPGR